MSKVILKKSSVASKVPTSGDLEYGELAINYTDGALYYKNSDNTVQVLNPSASAPVTYTADSISLTNGVYVSGSVTDIQTYNDGNFYQITDGTLSPGPAWIITVTFTGVTSFNRVVANLDYTQNSGHIIYFQVYNNSTLTWDNLGSFSGAAGYTQYALAVLEDTAYISSGTVQARLYHSSQGNAAHTTKLEYFALEQTTVGSQGPRGPAGTAGAAGAGLATGGSTGQYLRKSSTTDYDTAWNNITISEITDLQTTLNGKEDSGTASGLITTHESAVDPHPQYTTMPEIATASGDIHGIVSRAASTISFNDGTRTFTIAPVSGSWTFYHKGTLYTVSISKSITIANTSGARFIYIDPTTLELVDGGSVPDFANNVNLAYIYWDSVNSKSLILGDERHGSMRDTTWHTAQHVNVGTVWRSGGGLTYTLNDPSAVTLSVGTPLVIADEDLIHTINHSATPTANYEQILNTASLEVLYLSGTTYVSTAQSSSPWIGDTDASASVVFDGNGDYVTVPSNSGYAFGTNNFTVEFWLNIAGAGDHTGQHIFQTRDGVNNGLLIQYDRTNKYISATADTGFTAITTATNSILDNTWYHVAVVRNGSTAYIYINGTQSASGAITSNITGTAPYISRRYTSDGALHYVNGYISNLRVVNGTAVYTGAFTPSTTRLMPITGTTLLVFQDTTFKDNSPNNFTISTFGNTAISAQTPFTSLTLARYNYIVNGSGSLAAASEGNYLTYWLICTNDIKRPVKLVLGRNLYTNIDSAYAEDFTEYGLSFAEQVFMYQIVVQTSTTYTQNSGRVRIAGVRKILSKVTSTAATVSATNHSNLTGLQSADSHPISAITGLQTALDSKQSSLVSGTNIKTVNSTTLLGSGDIQVQQTLVSGSNIKTINGNSLLGSGDLVISGGGGGAGITLGQVVALSNGMAMP